MRLWHYKLIDVLPKQQLLGQWRELNLIWKEISEKGNINHIIVSYINDYSILEFIAYVKLVEQEMVNRKYTIKSTLTSSLKQSYNEKDIPKILEIMKTGPYKEIHNFRYLTQCFYNLQEKYDRGGIIKYDYDRLNQKYNLLNIYKNL